MTTSIDPTPTIVLGALAIGAVGFLLWKARKMGAERAASLRAVAPGLGLTWVGDGDATTELSPFPFLEDTVPRGLTNLLKGSRDGRDLVVGDYAFTHTLRDNATIWRQTVVVVGGPCGPDRGLRPADLLSQTEGASFEESYTLTGAPLSEPARERIRKERGLTIQVREGRALFVRGIPLVEAAALGALLDSAIGVAIVLDE